MTKPLLYLALLLASACGVHAQLLPIRNYTTREGLNANSINTILRDTKGMLWVGTYNGVNWYDGARFLQPQMSTHSGQIYVMHFMEDRHGQVWIATWYSGLYKYADGRFRNYLPDSANISNQSNSITDIAELDSGWYLAGTDHNAWLFDGTHFSLLDPANPLLNQQIHSVACTPDGAILIGLPQGLACYKKIGGRWTFAGLFLKGIDVNRIGLEGDQAWITCARGLYHVPSVRRFLAGAAAGQAAAPRLVVSGPVDNVFPQSSRDCWYTESALGAFLLHDGRPVREISKASGLPSGFVKDVYTDAEGITWLGTEYGLAKLTPAGYRFFPIREDSIHDANITAIAKDAHGGLWLGSYEGLYLMQGSTARMVVQPDGSGCGFVFSLLRDRRGQLWACTATGIYTIDDGRLHRRDGRIASGISEDDSGTLWFGCADGGILRYNANDNRGFRALDQPAGPGERIPGIFHDHAGFLWVGYALSGIRKFRVRGDSLQLVKEFSASSGNLLVRAMQVDVKGRLLVGTRIGGLYVFGPDGPAGPPVTMARGLSGNWVKGIAGDSGKVLLATNNGLDILGDRQDPSAVRRISFNDDRVPVEFNAVCLNRDTVWLGTASGVLEYVPESQVRDSVPPAIYITRAVINGRVDSSFGLFSTANQLPLLKYGQNNLSFDFAGLSFRNEAAVRYRYRLDGVDKDWSPPTDRRYVNYGNLTPGDYRFLVTAANGDGLWSTRPATVSFTIAAPFWRTPWFLSLCAILIIAVVYGLYRLRVHQILRIERLRQRISTDLHDDMGSTLSSISILSEMALQEEQAMRPAPALPTMIREIRENSLSLLERMDDIVWSINPLNDTLESLTLRIRRFAAQLFEARGIEYEIDIEPGIRHLHLRMEHRQHLYLIMKEAVNNLVKYAAARKAHIGIHSIRHLLVVRISDDGSGFDPGTGRSGNGIINMRSRAAAMNAMLDINSAPGRGTTVTVTLRLG